MVYYGEMNNERALRCAIARQYTRESHLAHKGNVMSVVSIPTLDIFYPAIIHRASSEAFLLDQGTQVLERAQEQSFLRLIVLWRMDAEGGSLRFSSTALLMLCAYSKL